MVMVEGAGSPAEINLRDGDIANMGFAEAVDCPVILIADIDRGGVFAHLVGTLELLVRASRRGSNGFVINRFRGDIACCEPGLDWLEQRTGKPVLGVLPYLHGLHLEAEDAITAHRPTGRSRCCRSSCRCCRASATTPISIALRLHPAGRPAASSAPARRFRRPT